MTRSATGIGAFVHAVTGMPGIEPAPGLAAERLLAHGALVAGTYLVESELGRGGLGTVYLARDLELGREVALKVLRPERLVASAGLEILLLLEREARATAALNHPNIVIAHRYGMWEGLPFLVLERLRGESLAARLERGRLPIDVALATTRQILAALEHAHAHGVLHRDLSPANVFLRDDGVVKILDFGMSSLRAVAARGEPRVSGPTLPGGGTPGYMAPEQERGEPVDARADLWAAGRLLARMLGREARAAAPPLPPWLARCLARACAEAPEDRYPDAATMRAALVPPPARGRRAVAAALLVLVLAAGLTAWRRRPGPAAASRVRPEMLLTTNHPEARALAAADAPALAGTYVTLDHPDDEDSALELERRGDRYHARMGRPVAGAPLTDRPLFGEGDAQVYRVGDAVYVVALIRILAEDREQLLELRLEPTGSLFLEVLVARDHDHVANGANVRGYRFTRVPGAISP